MEVQPPPGHLICSATGEGYCPDAFPGWNAVASDGQSPSAFVGRKSRTRHDAQAVDSFIHYFCRDP